MKLLSKNLDTSEDFLSKDHLDQSTQLMNVQLNKSKVLQDSFEKKKKEADLRFVELGTEDSRSASVSLEEAKNKIKHASDEFDEVVERVRARLSIPDLTGISG